MCFPVFPCICYPPVRFEPSLSNPLAQLVEISYFTQATGDRPRQSLGKNGSPFPLRCRPSLTCISSFPTKLSHKSTYPTSSSLQSRFTIPLTAIRFEFLYPRILFPNTGKIPDKIICPTLACFVFFSRFLYFSTIAVVPSLFVLFVPMCISMDPPFPLPTIWSTLSVTCSILAPGK